MSKKHIFYTDGACQGNPGPGGWGVVHFKPHPNLDGKHLPHEALQGSSKFTTNNIMEMTAVLTAIKAVPEGGEGIIHTDSQYVKNGITSWIHSWKKNGWRTSGKQPVKNAELWKELDEAFSKRKIDMVWVKGHNGHEFNELADSLATSAAKDQINNVSSN